MIYIDSSALVKLALAEPETAALADYLAKRSDQALVSSSLHRAEVLRAIWRAEPGALPRAQRMIRRVSLVSLTHDLLDNAATQAPASSPTWRTQAPAASTTTFVSIWRAAVRRPVIAPPLVVTAVTGSSASTCTPARRAAAR